ncbi:hypothetical protein F2P56_020557 [Juglans regia]|uniref:Retrotransposon Copia-like N-terminal domain-containing protein n=1 Tax=Juglans regia TaxID=51240 RepID=A0A833UR93_JUGRE|nr:hypothetical protein F2P56_020557 [Juglans regia]
MPAQLPLFNPTSSLNITKLSRANYPTWKATMLPYLKGQKVFGYLDGSLTPPSKELVAENGTTTLNPLFDIWETQDNLIVSCLNASLTDEVIAQVALCTTSHEVWIALTSSFASQSRAQIIQVQTQLSTARKTNQTVSEYFIHIKRLADNLAIAGQPLNTDDTITYLLAGLGPEYDSLVTIISARDASLTLEEVYSMLLTCEARIAHHSQSTLTMNVSANVATSQQNFSPYRGRSNSNRGRSSGNSNRGTGKGNFSLRNSDLWCQLCDKSGHTASRCYKRYDPHFLPPPPRRTGQANLSTNHSAVILSRVAC